MYVQTALDAAVVLLRTFGEVVHQTCQQNMTSVGVNLNFEDRRIKCESVRNSLQELCLPLQNLVHRSGPCQAVATRLLDNLNRL